MPNNFIISVVFYFHLSAYIYKDGKQFRNGVIKE